MGSPIPEEKTTATMKAESDVTNLGRASATGLSRATLGGRVLRFETPGSAVAQDGLVSWVGEKPTLSSWFQRETREKPPCFLFLLEAGSTKQRHTHLYTLRKMRFSDLADFELYSAQGMMWVTDDA